jgi:predicted nucleotidyltransferase
MKNTQLGGLARARSLTSNERTSIARKAAQARWKKRSSGVLQRSEIRRQVKLALGDRNASAFLFGSYARGEATPKSDVDLLVVEEKPSVGWMKETSAIRRRLTIDKSVDLIVMDQVTYDTWKNEYGTVQHEVSREGVRLV